MEEEGLGHIVVGSGKGGVHHAVAAWLRRGSAEVPSHAEVGVAAVWRRRPTQVWGRGASIVLHGPS